jgi:hypothetical protein
MKRKGAKIFDFQDWVEEYSNPIPEQWGIDESRKSKFQISGDSPQLEKKRAKILEFMKENESIFKEFELLTLDYARVLELEWPTVYPVIVKAAGELNDRAYVNARVFWPMTGGKKKELRFYICPYTDGLEIKSTEFKIMLLQKVAREMRKREKSNLLPLFDENEISTTLEIEPITVLKSKKK